jgi:prolyl-tRNA synthetase
VGASIEQNHDEKGIIWPEALAPFHVIIIPIGYDKSPDVKAYTESLYDQLLGSDYEVLLDDRQIRPGVKFTDAELIGIPHRIVISEKNIKNNQIEYRKRTNENSELISVKELMKLLS